MPLGDKASAPTGFLRFCSEQPEACGAGSPDAIKRAAVSSLAALGGRMDRSAPASVNINWQAAFAEARARRTAAPAPAPPSVIPAAFDWSAAFAEARARRELAKTQSAQSVAPVTFAGSDARAIKAVNSKVNRAIIRSADAKTYGRADVWALPLQSGALSGDCEDYVLEKRKALIEAGVAPQNLSIAIVVTQSRQTHAVLLVNTDKGELVLDNLSPHVLRWDETGYTWKRRQVAGSAFDWATVAQPAPLADTRQS